MTVPVIKFRIEEAEHAYAAHVALLKAEVDAPFLRTLPSFTMAKQDAYERFCNAFAKLEG